jgi:AcrR family transcriptional regulator
MTTADAPPSPRKSELLELAYQYAMAHGRVDMSLRPMAAAIGSSPRVLLYLFGSKDELVRALLTRARADELAMLDRLRSHSGDQGAEGLAETARATWRWLADESHRPLLRLWVDGYARSLTDPVGPWAGFAAATVRDWLDVLADGQPWSERDTPAGRALRTMVLAVLRGGLLDLLATEDIERTSAAVQLGIGNLGLSPGS